MILFETDKIRFICLSPSVPLIYLTLLPIIETRIFSPDSDWRKYTTAALYGAVLISGEHRACPVLRKTESDSFRSSYQIYFC